MPETDVVKTESRAVSTQAWEDNPDESNEIMSSSVSNIEIFVLFCLFVFCCVDTFANIRMILWAWEA